MRRTGKIKNAQSERDKRVTVEFKPTHNKVGGGGGSLAEELATFVSAEFSKWYEVVGNTKDYLLSLIIPTTINPRSLDYQDINLTK